MERDEIVKALECCQFRHIKKNCDQCKYHRWCEPSCRDLMCQDALALIKELAEENDKSDKVINDLIKEGQTYLAQRDCFQNLSKNLTEERDAAIVAARMAGVPFPEGLEIVHDFCQKEIKKAKADTVRGIADLLWQGESEKLNISVGGKYYDKKDFLDQIEKAFTLIKEERILKMRKRKHSDTLAYIEHAGYTAVQAANFHVTVYDNGRMVMHSSCGKKLSEDELREHIDFVRGIRVRSANL